MSLCNAPQRHRNLREGIDLLFSNLAIRSALSGDMAQGSEELMSEYASRVAHVYHDEATPNSVLLGEAPAGLWDGVSQLVIQRGFSVKLGDTRLRYKENISPRSNGYTNLPAKRVAVSDHLSGPMAVRTLIHELTHVCQDKLHKRPPDGVHKYRKHLPDNVLEIEAEAVAYLVCRYYGLSTSPYSVPKIYADSEGDMQLIESRTSWIVVTANAILEELALLS
jgi:hypothetical protein